MIKKYLFSLIVMFLSFTFSAVPVFAHAVVKPATAGIGSFTDFSLGVPSEKEASTTMVKLMLPAGLNNVSPIVKPGWKIDVKQTTDTSGQKDDDGNPAMIVSEIDWTGGLIPSGQKDLFMFGAQVPSQATELDWKVEQTYSDGSVVSWNLGPNDTQSQDSTSKMDYSKFGPYSKTMVINDLNQPYCDNCNKPTLSPNNGGPVNTMDYKATKLPLILSVVAIALSASSIAMQLRNRQNNPNP